MLTVPEIETLLEEYGGLKKHEVVYNIRYWLESINDFVYVKKGVGNRASGLVIHPKHLSMRNALLQINGVNSNELLYHNANMGKFPKRSHGGKAPIPHGMPFGFNSKTSLFHFLDYLQNYQSSSDDHATAVQKNIVHNIKSYKEILSKAETAIAVKTNGKNSSFIEGDISFTGNWRISENRTFSKVIVFLEAGSNASEIIIGDYLKQEKKGERTILFFNNTQFIGQTKESWTNFTEGKNRGYEKIYLQGTEDNSALFYPTEEKHTEGKTKQVYVNRYERDSKARKKCINHYGAECLVCGFKFESKYGELGLGFIHVHHVIPLSDIGEEYSVDPVKDLNPICPNCHAMLHKGNLLPEELKELISLIKKS